MVTKRKVRRHSWAYDGALYTPCRNEGCLVIRRHRRYFAGMPQGVAWTTTTWTKKAPPCGGAK